ncbi:MAG TPA: SDR family oxidoreductase [Gemmatimonadaceae bacterium]|nr:SDR family oxidoreductase [Gemmatimonadaceae bacterium]
MAKRRDGERGMKASGTVKDEPRTRSARKATGAAGSDRHAARGEQGARRNRELQADAERKEKKTQQKQGGNGKAKQEAVQAGARTYPSPPMPRQHQAKPGAEREMTPRPRYEAPMYRGSGKLRGMVALVTGGDSGIGRGVAVLYAREGADVAIVYLNEHDDAREAQRSVEAEGRRAILIPGDVTDPQFCRDAVERTVQELGKLDVLVNNAAFQQHAERLEDISDEQWDRTFRTNIYGYFYMARAALPHLGNGASIVNSGSVTGMRGQKSLLDYSSTKGAIHAFTKSLAQNVVDRGIRVNCVAPGPVWTPLNPADKPADEVAEFGKGVEMGRPAQPEELAPAYVFLAAPSDSSYITGEILPVLGGGEGG